MVAPITAAISAAAMAAVIFASTPDQARADLPKYKLPGDAKIYISATNKLATTFSLSNPDISIRLPELGDCSNCGLWTMTLKVGVGADPAAAGPAAILAVPMELYKDQLQIPAMDCHAQNDYPMHMALTNSVDEDTKGKVQGEKSEYTMEATGDIPKGMLYLRKLTMKAKVDLKTMAPYICDILGSLGTYMQTTANGNISGLNGCVCNRMVALSARGESKR
jgi:hypothetical protein